MHGDQLPYRELLAQLDAGPGPRDPAALAPLLHRWLAAHPGEISWLASLARVSSPVIPALPVEDLWRLYALSRVSDALITALAADARHAPAYLAFMSGLGLRQIATDATAPFHPFYHEIVTVTPALDATAPVSLTGTRWPGFLCGPLLIARAGVAVTGGSQHIRKEIAETSTLYWSYRRSGRPTEDLSVGWGSNSQWRTSFRRDYCLAGKFHYNVDAAISPSPDDRDLTAPERAELVRHRCFIVTARPHADLFPYDLRHEEPAGPASH